MLDRIKPWLARGDLALWLVLLAIVLTSPALVTGLSADDYILRAALKGSDYIPQVKRAPHELFTFGRGDPDEMKAYMERGVAPWWTTFEARFTFWRPLASLSHWFDFTLFPDCPPLMHLHSMLWFAAVVVVLTRLYRRMIPLAWVAGLAALFYAVDDAHSFAIAWLANRNGIMSAFFGVASLLAHDKWRREGWTPGIVAAPVLFGLGLACCEAALAVCGYLIAYAVFVEQRRRVQGAATLLPYAFVVVPWIVMYQYIGYGTTGSGQYSDPVREPILFVTEGLQRLPILLLAQLGWPTSSFWPYAPDWIAFGHLVFALAFLVFFIWVLWPMLRRDAMMRFWALGTVLSTLPFCATYPNDRLLFFAGIGGFGLVARFLASRVEPEEIEFGPQDRARSRRALAVFLVVVHGVIAPLMVPPNTLTTLMIDNAVAQASESAPGGPEIVDDGVVIVNAPADYLTFYVPLRRLARGEPVPEYMRVLYTGMDPVEVKRTGADTLVLRPDRGFVAEGMSQAFRGPGYPVEPGYTVKLEGLTVEVLSTTDDGRPLEVKFRFGAPLNAGRIHLITWDKDHYVPFDPPEVGMSVRLPAVSWFWFL